MAIGDVELASDKVPIDLGEKSAGFLVMAGSVEGEGAPYRLQIQLLDDGVEELRCRPLGGHHLVSP